MTAYYNEIDPYAAQWLRNLINAGHIAPGDVDERSIVDVQPDDLAGYTQCHFFAGIGGWSRALRISGWNDDRPVWTGSCPCQPFSLAGKQAGYTDERHLWPTLARLIKVRRPPVFFGEQVASASKWLRLVRGDLEALGFTVGAIPIEAASAGADHLRDRYWFVATADMGDPSSEGLALRPIAEVERGDLRSEGTATAAPSYRGDALADDAERLGGYQIHPDGRGRVDGSGSEQGSGLGRARHDSHLPNTERVGIRGEGPCSPIGAPRGVQGADEERERVWSDTRAVCDTGELEWVLGADGKARRVKSGICLLAHGVPARVGKLRAFGNAIDPRPAAAFIGAAMTVLSVSSQQGKSP